MEFLDCFPPIIRTYFFLIGPSRKYNPMLSLKSLEAIAAFFEFCSFIWAIACSNFLFHFFLESLDTLLPAALHSLNSTSKSLETSGYFSVCWDLFPWILLLFLIGLPSPVLCFFLFRVSSAVMLFLLFSHSNTNDLLTPCCFATVRYLCCDVFIESSKSKVFFLNSTV